MPYSCLTHDGLFYKETRQFFSLLRQKASLSEIKERIIKDNLFNASSSAHSRDVYNAIIMRLDAVDASYVNLFLDSNVETQKLMCIIMVMLTNHTFYSFMNDVYKEKLILKDHHLSSTEVLAFLHRLQQQDDKAAQWYDSSVKRYRGILTGMLCEAQLLEKTGRDFVVNRPLLSADLTSYLKNNGLEQINRILMGER